jgi:hypothetical protein
MVAAIRYVAALFLTTMHCDLNHAIWKNHAKQNRKNGTDHAKQNRKKAQKSDTQNILTPAKFRSEMLCVQFQKFFCFFYLPSHDYPPF